MKSEELVVPRDLLIETLKKVEWVLLCGIGRQCPFCGALEKAYQYTLDGPRTKGGHRKGCSLALLLSQCGEKVKYNGKENRKNT